MARTRRHLLSCASGIYFYCYENYVEVGIHANKNDGTAGPVNAPKDMEPLAKLMMHQKGFWSLFGFGFLSFLKARPSMILSV